MVGGFELGGDSGVLNSLVDAQTGHRNEFDRIMGDIKSQTHQVLGNWEGAGWEQKDADGKDFDDYFGQAQVAFQKLINATDSNATSIQEMASRMISRFSGR